MKFYVYVHRRADSGEIFYVGKGVGARARVCSQRGHSWREIYERYGRVVEYLAYFYEEIDALNFEREVIRTLRRSGIGLVNVTSGGQGTSGYVHTERAKKKMAAAAVGRKISEQARQKISEANKGRVMTPEHRARLSEANVRRFSTVERRKQVSECQKGRVFSAEHRARISAAKKGITPKPISQKTRERLSQAQRARFADPAEREKIRQARLNASRTRCEVVGG